MIERYWNEMFPEFKTGDRRFDIPGFTEPLMSPDFARRNIVGATTGDVVQRFKLCTFGPSGTAGATRVKRKAIKDIITCENFWALQKEHNLEAIGFIQRLLPFLVEQKKTHYYFFIEEEGELLASAIGGEGETTCFLFNLFVRMDYRRQGLAKEIFLGAQRAFPEKATFFWTKHDFFTLGANDVKNYHVIK